MDIKNIFDFDSRIKFLLQSYDTDIIGDIKKQDKFLNSDMMNENFMKIENYLNDMYEKIRVLEDVIDYAKIYVNNEIDATIAECRDLVIEIESMNDDIYSNSKHYITINVPLINNDTAQYSDRDGTSLKTCEIYGNAISLSGAVKNSVELSNVSVKRKEAVYESNYLDLLKEEPYRAYYLLDAVSKNGVSEEIQLDFKEPKEINSIKIKLSNCKIINIIYIHEDNTESYSSDISKGVMPIKIVKGIKLTINSTNYAGKIVSIVTTDTDRFDDLNKAWQQVYEDIKEKDNTVSNIEYKSKLCDYLQNIYLKEVK